MAINVKVYGSDSGACFWYRVVLPYYFLNENTPDFNVVTSRVLKSRDAEDYDVLICQRAFSGPLLQAVQKAKKLGKTVIYEIDDDLLHVPRWSPAWKVYGRAKIRRAVIEFMQQCDAVFVSTKRLAEVYQKFNPRIFVLPNSEDFDKIPLRPKNSRLPVVLWQGSNTHNKDLDEVGRVLKGLHESREVFVKTFSHPALGVYDVPFVAFESFYPLFANLDADVGIAPLTSHMFNLGKSNLKWLQYTACRIATVASKFGPYVDLESSAILVEERSAWREKVLSVVSDENLREDVLCKAVEIAQDKFDIRQNWKLWEEALKQCLSTVL